VATSNLENFAFQFLLQLSESRCCRQPCTHRERHIRTADDNDRLIPPPRVVRETITINKEPLRAKSLPQIQGSMLTIRLTAPAQYAKEAVERNPLIGLGGGAADQGCVARLSQSTFLQWRRTMPAG